MEILWNPEKNRILLQTRGVSFEMVLEKILSNNFTGPEKSATREGQMRIIVEFDDYPYVVPLVVNEQGDWFLKTIYPSRKEKRRRRNEE